MAFSNRSVAFLGVSLLLGLPAITMLVMKGLPKKPESTTSTGFLESPTAPEDILLAQLKVLKPGEDMKELTLRTNLGHVLRAGGRYKAATEQFKIGRDLAMRMGEGEQLGILQGLLGNAHYQQGRLKEARRELESGFLLVEPHGAAAFDILRTLASVKRDQGHLDTALELYEQIAKDKEMQAAIAPDAMVGFHNDLGDTYGRKGDSARALMHFHQALDRQEASDEMVLASAEANLELATAHNHIGQILHNDGDVEKSLLEYETALAIQKRAIRKGHPMIANTLTYIAHAQRDSGDREKALETLDLAEEMLLQTDTGAAFPEYGALLSTRADLLREKELFELAEKAALKALEIQTEAFGTDENPEVAVTLNGLGSIYHDQQRYQDAMAQYVRALTINLKTVGTTNPETAASYNNLGNVYQDAGDDTNARSYYMKTLEIQRATIGEKSPDVCATYNNLASILFRQGEIKESVDLFEKAVNVAKAAGLPKNNPDRAIYEENLQMALEELQNKNAGVSHTEIVKEA